MNIHSLKFSGFDHPEIESLEMNDEIMDGILLERPAALVLDGLEICYTFVDLRNGVGTVQADDASPGDEHVGHLVRPPCADAV